ncbi:MAG: DUF3470 domain-containing protein [Gammaproteobacteria bacterium]|nr:DUF3470 domain-containing protein [Gammaproteobacteria bacterium]
MTYVVTEPCIKCKYTDCVEVCPVDCFHEGANFLAIDPNVCIDCGLCVDECPVNAIWKVDDLPQDYANYVRLNAEFARLWPVIKRRKDPPPDADAWAQVKDKSQHLDLQ